jgi:hypothetical protein
LAEIPQVRWLYRTTWSNYSDIDQEIFENCIQDDIYQFGGNATFEYLLNGSTFMDVELNPLTHEDEQSGCTSPPPPWDESEIYTYSIDENNSNLIVNGLGAYIGLSHVANGNNEIESPSEAPDSITYNYTRITDDQILLELDAFNAHYRFTLERVLGN